MSILQSKVEYLRALTGIDIYLSDSRYSGAVKTDDGRIINVRYAGEDACVSVPKSCDERTVRLLAAYFADTDIKSSVSEHGLLLYKMFAGFATAEEISKLGDILGSDCFFLVILKTDSSEKWAELLSYLDAIAGQNDRIARAPDGSAVFMKSCDGVYSGSEELAEVLYKGITEERRINLLVSSGGSASGPGRIMLAYRRAFSAMQSGEGNIRHYRDCALVDLIAKAPAQDLLEYYDYFERSASAFFEDEELVETAKTFLNCNLSVTETAKKMYLHRNTLNNRLIKLQSVTGLDIRDFRQAQTLDYIMMAAKAIKKQK